VGDSIPSTEALQNNNNMDHLPVNVAVLRKLALQLGDTSRSSNPPVIDRGFLITTCHIITGVGIVYSDSYPEMRQEFGAGASLISK